MHTCIRPSSLSDSPKCTPSREIDAAKKVGRVSRETGASSSVENYVASPSIMKRPLIMKATEGVPSGGITIFHAYCLTAEPFCRPFCLPRYRPTPLCPICPLLVCTPSRTLFSSHRPFLCINPFPSRYFRNTRCRAFRIANFT